MEERIIGNQSDLLQTPAVVEEKKANIGLLIAISLIVILLIGVGGVYAGMQIGKKQTPTSVPTQISTPTLVVISTINTPDEPANWKTYTNTKYKFEFKYPEKWKFEEYLDNKIQIIAIDPQKTSLKENIQQALDGINGLVGVMASSDVNSSMVGWNALEKGTIGVDKINIRKLEERTNDNTPNPALSNFLT